MSSCSHPYSSVTELTIDARYANRPLNRLKLDFCTNCREILDIPSRDDTTLPIKEWANSCSHPFNSVEEKEVEIVVVGEGEVLQTIPTHICTECEGPTEKQLLELNFK